MSFAQVHYGFILDTHSSSSSSFSFSIFFFILYRFVCANLCERTEVVFIQFACVFRFCLGEYIYLYIVFTVDFYVFTFFHSFYVFILVSIQYSKFVCVHALQNSIQNDSLSLFILYSNPTVEEFKNEIHTAIFPSLLLLLLLLPSMLSIFWKYENVTKKEIGQKQLKEWIRKENNIVNIVHGRGKRMNKTGKERDTHRH